VTVRPAAATGDRASPTVHVVTVPKPAVPALRRSELSLARSAVDRAAHLRGDDAWLARAWADPATRVLRLLDARVQVVADPPELVWSAPSEEDGTRIFLGLDAGGVAYFALASSQQGGSDGSGVGLREVGALLSDRDAGLLVHAVALAHWHATHSHCPRCGSPTAPVQGGHVRRCPVDGSEHYPRTDPAVIMLVRDDSDRCLLGHQGQWPARRYSTLAGYVEPGESLEAAVRREVVEEVGVLVGDVHYVGSQPWPFPASLMLGFVADAADPGQVPLHVDGEEIADARWFTRAELLADVEAGRVLLPPPVSIARRLVEQWYGAALAAPPGW